MIKHSFILAFRTLVRRKAYSFLNIGGLALGLACCLVIVRYIRFEMSYDDFHENGDRIYRVVMTEKNEDRTLHSAQTYAPVAQIISEDLPEVESVVRILPWSVSVKTASNDLFQESSFVFADSLFFDVFSFHFVAGSKADALKSPHSLVVTESAAARLFSSPDVVGETLFLEGTAFRISGIVKDPPQNSNIMFSLVAPIAGARDVVGPWLFQANQAWHWPPVYTFCMLTRQGSADKLNAMFPAALLKHVGPDFQPKRDFALQPISDIHRSSQFENELVPTTDRLTVLLFGGVALIILVLAGINYTNLATARSLSRAREVGLRKVSGARRGTLVGQFLGESLVYSMIALAVAIALSEGLMPLFDFIAGSPVHSGLGLDAPLIAGIFVLTCLVGIVGGIYPAFVLSSFQPIRVLRGSGGIQTSGSRRWNLRSALVIVQFAVSIGLIICTITIEDQLSFIRNKDLGFQKERIIVVPIKDGNLQTGFQAFKNSVLSLDGIAAASALSNFPWDQGFYGFPVTISGQGKEESADMPTILVDRDFVKTLQMSLSSGRDFSNEFGTDDKEAFIVNEEALRKYGLDDPVGLTLSMKSVSSGKPKEGRIIGTVKDFHFQSLHRKVEPLVMTVAPESYYLDNLVVRVRNGKVTQALNGLKKLWSQSSPDHAFEYFFLDEAFEKLYSAEQRLGRIFTGFSVLAVVIGSLGLFGLASYNISMRMKEIGIRKVLGASAGSITALFSRESALLIGASLVIAWPLSFFIVHRWLENFAYQTTIGMWIFLAAAGIALVTVLLSVSIQAFRAALTNPVDAIKAE